MLVKIEVVVPSVLWQWEYALFLRVYMYKGVAIVEIDVSDGADEHTSCLGTKDSL